MTKIKRDPFGTAAIRQDRPPQRDHHPRTNKRRTPKPVSKHNRPMTIVIADSVVPIVYNAAHIAHQTPKLPLILACEKRECK